MKDAEGAQGGGVWGRSVPSPVGIWFGTRLYPFPRYLCKFHVEFTHFFEDYDSLRLTKFTN